MTVLLVGPINSGSAAGADGLATANGNSESTLKGAVKAVYVKYNDTPPATTDVTVRSVGTSPSAPTYNLLSIANAVVDGWFYPRVAVHDVSGAAISGQYSEQVIYDYVNVVIAGANAGDSADVWILLEY